MPTEIVGKRWSGTVIVAATGPSLTEEVANKCRGHNVLAVNDAYKLLPFAQVLYACDTAWWKLHKDCRGFAGEKWSSHGEWNRNDKRPMAKAYGLKLVLGEPGDTFSQDPSLIRYGGNSGFQAVNLAMHMGAERIVLVGFDMRQVGKKRHFFGNHPSPLSKDGNFTKWVKTFTKASKSLPPNVEIINATPGSALKCFPMMELSEALDVSGGT